MSCHAYRSLFDCSRTPQTDPPWHRPLERATFRWRPCRSNLPVRGAFLRPRNRIAHCLRERSLERRSNCFRLDTVKPNRRPDRLCLIPAYNEPRREDREVLVHWRRQQETGSSCCPYQVGRARNRRLEVGYLFGWSKSLLGLVPSEKS